jgi:FtsH-binding integral membrane protein
MTGSVTLVMMLLAMIFPDFFAKLGGVLFAALLGLVAVRLLQLFIPGLQSLVLIDWISAAIFSLYIGYDWNRATEIPKTLDNAVDVAVSIYLDVVNLFLSLFKTQGSSD